MESEQAPPAASQGREEPPTYSELRSAARGRAFLTASDIVEFLGGKAAARRTYLAAYDALASAMAGGEPRPGEAEALSRLLQACWVTDPRERQLDDRYLRQLGLLLKIHRAPVLGTIATRPGIAKHKTIWTPRGPEKAIDQERTVGASPYVGRTEGEIRQDYRGKQISFLVDSKAARRWVRKGYESKGEARAERRAKLDRLLPLRLYKQDEIDRLQHPLLITRALVPPAAVAMAATTSTLARKAILGGESWVNRTHRTPFSPTEIGTILVYAYEVAPELQAHWRRLVAQRPRLTMAERRARMKQQFPGLRVEKINRRFGGRHRTATDQVAELVTASFVGLEPEVIRKKYRSRLRQRRNVPPLGRPGSRPLATALS